MTDANKVIQDNDVPPSVEQIELTPEEKIESIKTYLFTGVLRNFQAYSDSIARLPVDDSLKMIIRLFNDTTWLWVKEAFQVLKIESPAAPRAEKKKKVKQKKKKRK